MPNEFREQLVSESLAAFPRECCGLIEGKRHDDEIEALALHPAQNLARDDDRFEIDPAEHFQLLRDLRGSDREIVGCYHSHPNGLARPSPRDLEAAGEEGFVWLIAAVSGERDAVCAAYRFSCGAFRPLAISPSLDRETPAPL